MVGFINLKPDDNLSFVGAGNFLVAADQHKVVIFNSKSGEYIRTLVLPPRYVDRNLKGHKDFAFSKMASS